MPAKEAPYSDVYLSPNPLGEVESPVPSYHKWLCQNECGIVILSISILLHIYHRTNPPFLPTLPLICMTKSHHQPITTVSFCPFLYDYCTTITPPFTSCKSPSVNPPNNQGDIAFSFISCHSCLIVISALQCFRYKSSPQHLEAFHEHYK